MHFLPVDFLTPLLKLQLLKTGGKKNKKGEREENSVLSVLFCISFAQDIAVGHVLVQ